MVRTLVAAALCALAFGARAETLKFFGSLGAEAQLTPANTASPLNPRNVARIPYRTNVADATLFADATPESRRWKLHLKLRADANDRTDDQLTIGEGYLQVSPRPWLDLTAGRVIEKWGTGYAWNPTAFVSPRKNPSDPSDRRSSYRGVDMLRADLFVRGTNVSLYALQHGAFAARAYRLIAGTDVSLHFRRDDHGTSQGVSAARVFGDSLELHAEVARRRALLGGQYTFHNNVNVVAELYRDGDGLSARQWDTFRAISDLRAANSAYRPLQMARNYAFARVAWPSSDQKLDVELITIASLRDGSALARLTISRKLRANLTAYLIETEMSGRAGSELAYMQVRRVTTFGARLWF